MTNYVPIKESSLRRGDIVFVETEVTRAVNLSSTFTAVIVLKIYPTYNKAEICLLGCSTVYILPIDALYWKFIN